MISSVYLSPPPFQSYVVCVFRCFSCSHIFFSAFLSLYQTIFWRIRKSNTGARLYQRDFLSKAKYLEEEVVEAFGREDKAGGGEGVGITSGMVLFPAYQLSLAHPPIAAPASLPPKSWILFGLPLTSTLSVSTNPPDRSNALPSTPCFSERTDPPIFCSPRPLRHRKPLILVSSSFWSRSSSFLDFFRLLAPPFFRLFRPLLANRGWKCCCWCSVDATICELLKGWWWCVCFFSVWV